MNQSLSCILFALQRERFAFCTTYRPRFEIAGAPCWAYVCHSVQSEVLVLETGVGRMRMKRALDWLFTQQHPPSVIMAGFCGALTSEHQTGDLIFASEIVDTKHHSFATTWTGNRCDAKRRNGRILTMPVLIGDPTEKTRLAAEYDAVAVDMESAVVAERCKDAGIPFACLRAVSDDCRTALSPQLVSLLSGGRVSIGKILKALVRRPQMTAELWRLAKDTRLAARRLGHALVELLSPADGG